MFFSPFNPTHSTSHLRLSTIFGPWPQKSSTRTNLEPLHHLSAIFLLCIVTEYHLHLPSLGNSLYINSETHTQKAQEHMQEVLRVMDVKKRCQQ